MLETRNLSVSYGKHRALDGVSLKVAPGEIVVILGANGAGKSTLLKAIAGICEGRVAGEVTMAGEKLMGLAPHKVVERGVALVPEGRGIFGDLSVRDNLMLGANPDRARDESERNFERLVQLFPTLAERGSQIARTMSGGEQQMVAIGRAMMSNPVILMLDEPSLGLSPLLSKELFQNLKAVREAGLGILLVEQNARLSLGIADRGYLLENGEILREDRAEVLKNDPAVQAAYLGGAAGADHARAAKPAAGTRPAPATAAAPPAAETAPPPAPASAPSAAPASLPPRIQPRAHPAGTRPADAAGLDIGALVARASARATPARAAAPPLAATSPTPTPAPRHASADPGSGVGAPHTARLNAVIKAIEEAASAARTRAAAPGAASSLPPLRPSIREWAHRGAARPPASTPAAAPADDLPTPRPGGKVEIWRRRPGSSQFDRMES